MRAVAVACLPPRPVTKFLSVEEVCGFRVVGCELFVCAVAGNEKRALSRARAHKSRQRLSAVRLPRSSKMLSLAHHDVMSGKSIRPLSVLSSKGTCVPCVV